MGTYYANIHLEIYTESNKCSFIIVSYNNNSYMGLSIINEADLYKSGSLAKLQADLGIGSTINIEIAGVPKTKLAYAIGKFLQNEANKNRAYALYSKAGWVSDEKMFYTFNSNDALFFQLKKIYPKLPVFKRTLKNDNLVVETPHFNGNRQICYDIAFYGSILMTLLQESGADTGFVVWLPNNSRGIKFADHFFRVWENYQSKIDISQKKQMKEIVNEAKDEPVIIDFDGNRQDSKMNLTKLLNNFLCGSDCAGVGKLEGIPIIMSDNFFKLIELVEEPERILPLIPDMEEQFIIQNTSVGIAAKFVEWCNENYNFVVMIINRYSNLNVTCNLENTFLAILIIANMFLENLDVTKTEQIGEAECTEKASNELMELQNSLKKFLEKTKAEMFGKWLSQCLSSSELTLKHNDDVTEGELNGQIVVYDNSGEVYFDDEAFKTVLKKGEMTDYDFMLGALAKQDAIQTEAKNNDSVTYKVKCAVPSGCGRNQRRMIKFKAKVLMDEEGAEFDGELLQGGKTDEVTKNPYYIEIGTRGKDKALKYDPYCESNTNGMVLVTGMSGSGKTNFSYNMIRQALKQNVIVLVPDYSGSFEVGKFSECDRSNIFSAEDFPVSPFSKITPYEEKETTARRCANLLKQILEMGVYQEQLLKDIIVQLLNNERPVTLSSIANAINNAEEPEFESIRRLDIYNKINAFEKSKKTWNDIYNSNTGLYVIKFDERYTSQDQIKCTELLLISLFEWLRAQGQEKCNKKIQVHLDEAQSLRHAEQSPLTLLMRQGRKFGLSVFLYTQSLLTFDTNVKEIWTQAALLVNFQQTQKGAGQLAKFLEDDEKEAKELTRQLRHLKKGEAIASGCFQKNNGLQTNTINVRVQTPLVE